MPDKALACLRPWLDAGAVLTGIGDVQPRVSQPACSFKTMTFIIVRDRCGLRRGAERQAAGAGMDGRAEQPGDFASAFEGAFARLQVLLEMVCVSGDPWPERVHVAVRQVLEFAASDPVAASVLTNAALAQGGDGIDRYERLMSYLAGLLEGGRAESLHGPDLPATMERSLAGGVATIVANRLTGDRAPELPGLVAEVVQFVLTPYYGTAEARRLSRTRDWPGSQPDR